MPHKCIFAIVAWLLCSLSANANNNLFLPGDSFFPTVLSEERLEALAEAADDDRTFTYSSLGGYPGAFCGYAGYDVVRFTHVDDEFVKNLRHVYDKIRQWDFRTLTERRQNGEVVLTESNPIGVLFYRSDFEFGDGELGLRYNENWVQQVVRFGYEPTHVRLCCLLNHPDAVMLSWRDAERFPALDIVEPDVDLNPGQNRLPGRKVTTPVTVTSRIKAFVIGSYKLDDFFRPTEEEAYMVLYIVDSDGVRELEYVDGKWAPPEEDDLF